MLNDQQILLAAVTDADEFPVTQNVHETAFFRGAKWANEQNAAEIAELVQALHRVLAKSPAGSQYEFWMQERQAIQDLLKKYGK